jgi:putative ABC transport system ATP-binding protein
MPRIFSNNHVNHLNLLIHVNYIMIEIQNVTKTYESGDNETQALKGVTFTIKDGEFVAIMGPSGSGKSTLMHIIGALDTPTTGKYLLDGKDVSELSEEQLGEIRKNKIGFVFQAFNLLPRTTVLRNVELPLMYAEVPKQEREILAKKALLSAGMSEDRFLHFSNQISGGQMQRVAIARALVNNPSLILADEPTGNLDTKTGEIVLGTFQKLNRQGHTVVLITHERDVAEHAQKIILLRDGVIVKQETTHTQKMSQPDLVNDLL